MHGSVPPLVTGAVRASLRQRVAWFGQQSLQEVEERRADLRQLLTELADEFPDDRGLRRLATDPQAPTVVILRTAGMIQL